jgi:hypothetical protein
MPTDRWRISGNSEPAVRLLDINHVHVVVKTRVAARASFTEYLPPWANEMHRRKASSQASLRGSADCNFRGCTKLHSAEDG